MDNFDPEDILDDLDDDSKSSVTEAVLFDKKITTLQRNIEGGLLGFGVKEMKSE